MFHPCCTGQCLGSARPMLTATSFLFHLTIPKRNKPKSKQPTTLPPRESNMTASPNNMNAAPISAAKYCENYYRNLLANATATNGAHGCATNQQDVTAKQPSSCSSSNNSNDSVSNLIRPNDILSGRGRMAWNIKGNQIFRSVVHQNIQRYMEAKTNRDKTAVIGSVLKYLQCDMGSRFVKVQKGSIKVLGKREAHEKIGHAMRDLAKQRRDALAEAAAKGATSSKKIVDTLPTPKFVPSTSITSTCSAPTTSSEFSSVLDNMTPVGFLNDSNKSVDPSYPTQVIEPTRSMPGAVLRRDNSLPLDTTLFLDCFGSNQSNNGININNNNNTAHNNNEDLQFLDAFEPIPLAWSWSS